MLAEAADVLRALRLPPESTIDVEPSGLGVERWSICPPAGSRTEVVLRAHPEPELAANHVAVVEALSRLRFAQMPRPLAAIGAVVVEESMAAVSALSLLPPEGSVDAAMRALAGFHALAIHEGHGWDPPPDDRLPAVGQSLHRLGFASHEREAASPWLALASDEVLRSPWGFAHRDATALNVLLAPGRAWLAGLHAAGFGPQLFDVAAFLLTAGLTPDGRRSAATIYASASGRDATATVDIVDLAGILWGIGELLILPRRSIALLGDDAASAALNTAALRIERGIREPAGAHPAAAGIRAALWPS